MPASRRYAQISPTGLYSRSPIINAVKKVSLFFDCFSQSERAGRPLFSMAGHFFPQVGGDFLDLGIALRKYKGKPPEAKNVIWEFRYGEIQRKTAGGGKFLRFGHFPIGKYKGKPPEAVL